MQTKDPTSGSIDPDPKPICNTLCWVALALLAILLLTVWLFYEPAPSPGDMCTIFG